MSIVTSHDGTPIAFERVGTGAPIILVDGAFCYREAGPMRALARQLAPVATVYSYDRRARGESGDTLPYSVEREIDDIAALLADAGGHAALFGMSSGGALAIAAAAALGPIITTVAAYEIPVAVSPDAHASQSYTRELTEALAAGRPGDAVMMFLKLVGVPDQQIEGMRASPGWPALEALGPSLAYDNEVLGDNGIPHARIAEVSVPALMMAGESGAPFIRESAERMGAMFAEGSAVELPHQGHDVDPTALASVLIEFLDEHRT